MRRWDAGVQVESLDAARGGVLDEVSRLGVHSERVSDALGEPGEPAGSEVMRLVTDDDRELTVDHVERCVLGSMHVQRRREPEGAHCSITVS